MRFITASLVVLTFVYASGITLYLKDLLSYSSYNRSAEAVPFPDIPTAYWIIPSITVSLFYKNDILLNVSLHIFRNPAICGIYIQYVCKCQILVDFHPDQRTLRPISFHPDYFRIIDLLSSKGLFHHRNLHLPYHWHIDDQLKLYCPWDLPPAFYLWSDQTDDRWSNPCSLR